MLNGGEADRDREVADARLTAWPMVYGLAWLQLVVTLGWMAYAYFQPKLLERFGLTAFVGPLAFYLGTAGPALAPLIGSASDRIARRGGARVSLVIGGGVLAGATFVAVASIVNGDPGGALRWILLALIALWIAAMTVFQAPALCLLPLSAPADRWPTVASPMVVATVLPVALWPIVRPWFDLAGGVLTFLAGGIAVVLAAFALRRAVALPVVSSAPPAAQSPPAAGALVLAFGLGAICAFVTRLAAEIIPRALSASLGSGDATLTVWSTATLGASTVFAPSLAPLAQIAGKRTALFLSLAVAGFCALVAPLSGSIFTATAIAVLMGAALAVCLDCALPFAFAVVPGALGLAAGLYLGGVFAGSQLATLIL